ncbi:hypothetical protein O6H91_04G078400 [Diphasiastrum complanatum]|uniref:Uncharacterized protein n=1 Tax=Diphasiastrum complanatum TaxID=34168 RepID=A0ACC2DYR1_DIPCM|nr:hypothetical protein O6H91_04G078400 [Diphasiastrum complanatum]
MIFLKRVLHTLCFLRAVGVDLVVVSVGEDRKVSLWLGQPLGTVPSNEEAPHIVEVRDLPEVYILIKLLEVLIILFLMRQISAQIFFLWFSD